MHLLERLARGKPDFFSGIRVIYSVLDARSDPRRQEFSILSPAFDCMRSEVIKIERHSTTPCRPRLSWFSVLRL